MNRSETLEQLKLSMAAVENLENLTWRMYRVSLFTFDLLREQEFARRFSAFNQAQSNVLLGENRTETSFYVLRDTASQVAVEWLAMATISQANGKMLESFSFLFTSSANFCVTCFCSTFIC